LSQAICSTAAVRHHSLAREVEYGLTSRLTYYTGHFGDYLLNQSLD